MSGTGPITSNKALLLGNIALYILHKMHNQTGRNSLDMCYCRGLFDNNAQVQNNFCGLSYPEITLLLLLFTANLF